MSTAPVIETDRLTLRPHRAEDFDGYAALFGSDRARFMGKLNRRHTWYSFCSDVAQWALVGDGAWAIEERRSGAVIGQVAIQKPDHFPEIELGWFLFPEFGGQGYATEAARAARDWAYGPGGLNGLVSYINIDNTPSIALAQRLGCTRDPDAILPEGDTPEDTSVWRHRASEAAP